MYSTTDLQADLPDAIFVAVIDDADDSSGGWRYGWTEQTYDATTGTYSNASPARNGTTTLNYATELNDSEVLAGSLQWMRYKGDVDGLSVFEFKADAQAAVGTTITVAEVDGSPSGAADTILLDQADGFSVSFPAAGVARIDLTHPTPTIDVGEVGIGPIVTADTILFDENDGFIVTDMGGGVARVDLDWYTNPITIAVRDLIFTIDTDFTLVGGATDYFIVDAPIKLKGDAYLGSVTVPIDGQIDDLDPSDYFEEGQDGAVVIRFELDSDSVLTGIVPRLNTGTGQLYKLENTSDEFTLTLTHLDTDSAGENTFFCPGGQNFDVPPFGGVWIWYDPESEGWRVNSTVPGGVPDSGDHVHDAPFGEAFIDAQYELTADNTWTDSGLDIVIPSAGTWLIHAVLEGTAICTNYGLTLGLDFKARLYDETAAAAVPLTEKSLIWLANGLTYPEKDVLTITKLFACDEPRVIRVELWRNNPTTKETFLEANSYIGYHYVDDNETDGFEEQL